MAECYWGTIIFLFVPNFFFLSERAGTVAINLAVPAAVPAAVPGGSSDGPSRRGGSISSTAIGVDSNPTHWMMDRTYVDPLSLFFFCSEKKIEIETKRKPFKVSRLIFPSWGWKRIEKEKDFYSDRIDSIHRNEYHLIRLLKYSIDSIATRLAVMKIYHKYWQWR